MKNKPFEMCMLFDFYGEMLTEKQKDIFDLYYNEDLSLSEIGEHLKITRQGVRDAVLRAEIILREMEQKLGLIARYGNIYSDIQKIYELSRNIASINIEKYRNDQIQKNVIEIADVSKKLANLEF